MPSPYQPLGGRCASNTKRPAPPCHSQAIGLAAVTRVPGPKNKTSQQAGRELLEFCKTRQADVLRFTADTSLWPTNNLSERAVRPQDPAEDIRPPDQRRRHPGPPRYPQLPRHRRKHGLDADKILCQLMTANPWLPPSPANLPVTTQSNSRHHHRPFTGVNAYFFITCNTYC
jgi:hypothetical protein